MEVAGRIRSPMAVEPRISENSKVIGISTPVNWRLRRSVMHLVQRAGLPEDCRNPACLKTGHPARRRARRTTCSVEGMGFV